MRDWDDRHGEEDPGALTGTRFSLLFCASVVVVGGPDHVHNVRLDALGRRRFLGCSVIVPGCSWTGLAGADIAIG